MKIDNFKKDLHIRKHLENLTISTICFIYGPLLESFIENIATAIIVQLL